MINLRIFASLTLLLGTATSTYASSLEQTDWELSRLATYSESIPTVGRALSLGFNQGMAYGFNGCNNFNTSYTQNESKTTLTIEAERAMSTAMACMPQMEGVSKAFDQALHKTTQYKLNGRTLTLLDKKGKTLAQFNKPLTELPNTEWRVSAYNSGSALVSSLVSEQMTAAFDKKGNLSGFSGCNTYNSSYTIDPTQGTIKIAPIGSTKKLCAQPEDVMKEERLFLKTWQQVRSYQRLGNVLNLFDHKGTKMLTFSLLK